MELTCFYIIGHLFVRILLPAVGFLCLSGISIHWIMSPDTKKANNIALQANKKAPKRIQTTKSERLSA